MLILLKAAEMPLIYDAAYAEPLADTTAAACYATLFTMPPLRHFHYATDYAATQ